MRGYYKAGIIGAVALVTPPHLGATPRKLPTKWDAIFVKEGGKRKLPLPYLRALSWHESRMNAKESKGPAWGLLQIVPVVLRGYNKRHKTKHIRKDLLNPIINTRMASDSLRRIITLYARTHTDRNLKEDWNNPRFVENLTYAWNSGYSNIAGFGKVAAWLEKRGIPVTVRNVRSYNSRHRIAPVLYRNATNNHSLPWSQKVGRTYMREAGIRVVKREKSDAPIAALAVSAAAFTAWLLTAKG